MTHKSKWPPNPKSKWPPGPWHDEPDYGEWERAGLKCNIKRGPVGAWCGYVGVPKGHPAFGMPTDPVDSRWYGLNENQQWWWRHVTHPVEVAITEIHVHGGLTYAAREDDGLHYFGFDCSHFMDLCPAIDPAIHSDIQIYRTMPFVVDQTNSLAEQLAEIEVKMSVRKRA